MRCHHDNCTITERAEEYKTHVIEDGQHAYTETETGDLFAMIHVSCRDCGAELDYSRHNMPKWLRSHLLRIKLAL